MIVKCPVCGKKFDVLWPQLYKFRRGSLYLCSWGCVRQYDRNEENEMAKISKEQKNKAVEIALEGGDPRPYLKECGSKNPDNLWYWMKNQMKTKEPELYEKLARGGKPAPINGGDWEKMEIPEKAPTVKVDGPLKIETKEPEKIEIEAQKCTKPLNYDGYDVTAIRRDNLGEFYHDVKFTCIDWRTPAGDEVSLSPDGWRQLRDELPKILQILGVEA